ncbi:MAG: hypothetical protein FJX73_00795 [Armatimonadetes bacterium]|nr:hypothetical protein [Armatimonadota bacterium]
MAADPFHTPELAALHQRIGRDVAELRSRLRKGGVTLRLGPVVSDRAGVTWITALGAAAGLLAGRLLRARCGGGRPARGL